MRKSLLKIFFNLLLPFCVYTVLVLTQHSTVFAIETDCVPSGGQYLCTGSAYCGGAWRYPCSAVCPANELNGAPFCTSATTCSYSCVPFGSVSGNPKESPTWVRVITKNYDGNNYWAPEAQYSKLATQGQNRIDDKVSVVGDLHSDIQEGPRLTTLAVWADRFCAQARPSRENAAGDLDKTNSTCNASSYCWGTSRDSCDRAWCIKYSNTPAHVPAPGCDESYWFGKDYSSANGVDLGDSYHFLDEVDGLIEYMRGNSTIPAHLRVQNFSNAFTYNIVSRSEYLLLAIVTAPNSYFCDSAYYVENNQTGRSQGVKSITKVNGGDSCYATHAIESSGNLLMFEMKKAVKGRVIGINYANGTNVGLSGRTVELRAGNTQSGGVLTSLLTITTTTDSNGYYAFRDNRVGNYAYYTVDVLGAAPAGYTGDAYAVRWDNPYLANGQNIAFSYKRAGTVGDVSVGDATYAIQTTSAINDSLRDCSSGIPYMNYPEGRCWFGYRTGIAITNPVFQPSTACLLPSSNETIRWTPSVDSDPGQTITYALRIYEDPCATGVGTQTLSNCSWLLHSNNAVPNNIVSGYVNYSGYSFDTARPYSIYLKATSSDGSTTPWVYGLYNPTDIPAILLRNPTNLKNGSVSLSWAHARATSFNVFRDNISKATGITALTYTVPQACDGLSHVYRVDAINACGTKSSSRTYTCVTPKPTCNPIQYYNGTAWVNYTTQTFNPPGLAKQFRSSASGGVAPLTYNWSTTCGTINTPASTSITYTSPAIPSMSCQLSFSARSATGIATDQCTVTVTVNTQPKSDGTRSFTGLTLTKATARTGSLNYNVINYVNATSGTATILTTAGSICDPLIGTCAFSTGGLTKQIPSSSGTTTHPITVTLKNNNYGIRSGGTFPINTTFKPGGATTALPVERGTVTVSDALPLCTSITYSQNPTRAFPGTINMTFGVRDDWSLKGFGVGIFRPDGTFYKTSPAYSNSYFTLKNPITDAVDARTVIAPWTETAAIPSGLYYTRAYLADWYGYHNPPYTTTRYRWCTPVAGYNPYILVDNDAPRCLSVAFTPASPTTVSPVTISSTANDQHLGITRYRFLVYNRGTPKGTGTPIYDSGIIAASSAANTSITRTASWNTSTLPRGSYDVYADWYDSLGNMTNTNASNACVGLFDIPSGFIARVSYPKDNETYGYTHREASAADGNTTFDFQVKKTGVWSSPGGAWQDTVGGCVPTFPDNNNPSNDHDTTTPCNSYFRTSTTYNGSATDLANIRIKLPKLNERSKYINCRITTYNDKTGTNTGQVNGVIEAGPVGYEYCRPPADFVVVPGTSSGTSASMYPTRVEFQLDYGTDRFVGRVLGPSSDFSALQWSPSYITSISSTIPPASSTSFTNAYFVLPNNSLSENYWRKSFTGNSSVASLSFSISSGSLNQQCFYRYDNSNTTGVLTEGSPTVVHNWFKTGLMTQGVVSSNTCVISDLQMPNDSQKLVTPSTQAKLFVMMGPVIRVADSFVRFVEDSASCSSPTQLPPAAIPGIGDVTVTLSGGIPATSITVNGGGGFTFNEALPYEEDYTLSITSVTHSSGASLDLSNFGFCTGNVANALNFHVGSTPGSELENYPLGSTAGNISKTIVMFRKDSNSWYQTYNGGVHSNRTLNLKSNVGAGSSQGMPAAGVIVGNPTDTGIVPLGVNMYSALGIGGTQQNVGGLVSSFSIQPTSFVNFGNPPISWGNTDLVASHNQYLTFAQSLDRQFDEVEALSLGADATWGVATSVSDAINGTISNQMYFESSNSSQNSCSSNCNTTYLINAYRVAFIDFAESVANPTLTINQNIDASSLTNGLTLYVNGDVIISPDVTELDGVTIIATGNISVIEGNPEDSDDPLNIRGSLYGNDVVFDRNLNETDAAYVDSPAVRVLFNPYLISQSNLLPSEVTISNVYYEIKE